MRVNRLLAASLIAALVASAAFLGTSLSAQEKPQGSRPEQQQIPKPEEPQAQKPAQSTGASLDGKTFTCELIAAGQDSGETEELTFKGGTLSSMSFGARGFTPTTYVVKASEGDIRFESEMKSGEKTSVRWRGVVKGDTIEGSVSYSKQGQAPVDYSFKGTLKK